MPARNRPLVALISLMGALIGMLILAATASAAPYTSQPTTSVSNQTPVAGGSFTLSGSGFDANENVRNTMGITTFATAHTNASGDFSVIVTLPAGITGAQTIVSTGLTSGRTSTVTIMIEAATATAGSSAGSGGLASTGVAVLGIGGLGTLLLVAGGALLLAGKRRRVDA